MFCQKLSSMALVRSAIKKVYIFFINIVETFKWIVKAIFYSDLKNHICRSDNRNLLTILANGPSLKEELDKLDYTVGDFSVVNRFYESPYYVIIKPRYYVLADPEFFKHEDEIKKLTECVDWEMTLIVSYTGWKKLAFLRNLPNKHITVLPYHSNPYKGFMWLKYFLYKRGLSMPTAQNVLVPSIFNGINMGYKEIRLYGADHSWTKTLCVDKENQVCAVDVHFYEDEKEVKLLPYLKCPGEYYKLHELLRDFAKMFESYHQIRWYADKAGCRILNCTKDSFIDAFERE